MDAQFLDPNRFAAIVYDDGAKVDGLMSGFARELIEAGVDARGIVQLPPDADGCGPGALMKLRDVATGEVIPLCQDLGPGAGSCCLDSSALAGTAQRLRVAASRPTDILFFSKFGKQEAAGGGMRAELAYAISEGRTTLTAVKRALLPAWLSFTGGQGTLLEQRLWVIRNWWLEIASSRARAA
jgi:molybdate transport system ATP-binding protein